MIRLSNVSKSFQTRGASRVVARNISVTFPTGISVALMGRNGAGKSTLIEMISGSTQPDRGEIITDGTISWPVGFAGSFHRELTGAQNTRFIARVYGVDTDELSDFVEDFAELGAHYHMPFRTYSSGMRSRLSFGVSMGIRFDTYLIDEVTGVGDAVFRQKSSMVLRERLKTSSAILVTHSLKKINRYCQAGAVLENGRLTYFDDVTEAVDRHSANMGADATEEEF